MRVLTALLVLLFSLPVFSQSSPDSVLLQLRGLSDELVSYAQDLSEKGVEITDQMLRQKVFAMFDSIMVGEALDSCKAWLDDGLERGWVLANTDDFEWALPWPASGKIAVRCVTRKPEEILYRCSWSPIFYVRRFYLEDSGEGELLILGTVSRESLKMPNMSIRLLKTSSGWKIGEVQRAHCEAKSQLANKG
jgi:hypothetical protein